MSERELIIKSLYLIRECLINIANSKSERNIYLIGDINECIIDLETLPKEV